MKSYYFALLLLILLVSPHLTEAQVRFGIKGGVNSANLRHEAINFDPLLRFQGGVVVDVSISPHFSIQPSFLYSAKGYSVDFGEFDQNGKPTGKQDQLKLKVNYVEIPFLALYKTELGKGFRFFAGVGPYLGIGIDGKATSNAKNYEDQPISFNKEGLRALNYERFDYGLSAAVGLEYRNFMLGLNYNSGLRNVLISTKSHNRTLGLTAGYLFGKGK